MLAQQDASRVTQYVYGQGDSPLAGYDGTAWTYLSGRDGINSVRQETDASGNVITVRGFDPYGVPLSGNGGAPFGYTGEMADVTELVFLRARYMQPMLGMFLSRDPWMGYEQQPGTYNGFNYAMGNPVNLSDPSGLQAIGILGPAYFARCFDLHTASPVLGVQGDPTTAKQAVEICKAAYSNANWDRNLYFFELGQDLPKTAHELMGWFLYDWRGKYHSDRLFFDAKEPLTQELIRTSLIEQVIRPLGYSLGNTDRQEEYPFDIPEFVITAWYDIRKSAGKFSLPISVFMGGFWYQFKIVDMGQRIGFRIDNDTTLSSGTHIGGRHEPKYFRDVETLIDVFPYMANKPLYEIIRDEDNKLLSILRDRTRGETRGGGGGNLYQTFTWTEKRPCSLADYLLQRFLPDIQVWDSFRFYTTDPEGWPAQ